MDLPRIEEDAALAARLLLWEAVLLLAVSPQVDLDLAREGALGTRPQLIVSKLFPTARQVHFIEMSFVGQCSLLNYSLGQQVVKNVMLHAFRMFPLLSAWAAQQL